MDKDLSHLTEVKTLPNPLSRYEIACITMGVPATGDPILDKIITVGLQVRVAADLFSNRSDISATTAVSMAKELLQVFKNGQT